MASPALADSSRLNTTRAQLTQLEAALAFFEMDNGRLPTTEEGLEALVEAPADLAATWNPGGYLRAGEVPHDAWGNAYHYHRPGLHNTASFDLWSLGADGRPGGECVDGDVGNWAGAEGDPCTSWADPFLPAATLGIVAGLAIGLPLHLVRTGREAARAKSWRPLARGIPALVFIVLLSGAVAVLLFGIIA